MTPATILYPRASEAEALRQSEVRHADQVTGRLFVVCLVIAFVSCVLAAVAQVPVPTLATLLGALIGLCGFCAVALFMWAYRKGRRHLDAALPAVPSKIEPEVPAAGLPTLPTAAAAAETDTFRLTTNGRGEDVPKQNVHGFDPRDLWWLCRHIANGNKFTEAAMENIALPYSGELLGQAKEGTPYTRFMNLCVRSGVIVDRGGAGNKAGTLAITDANEILRLIKQQPE